MNLLCGGGSDSFVQYVLCLCQWFYNEFVLCTVYSLQYVLYDANDSKGHCVFFIQCSTYFVMQMVPFEYSCIWNIMIVYCFFWYVVHNIWCNMYFLMIMVFIGLRGVGYN